MKHLPNLLTLANLFCGCIAIAYILTADASYYQDNSAFPPVLHPVLNLEQIYIGSMFIGVAAICDMLDGLAARALKVFSPIGADLDSLADIVSFGVAPSAILYKFLFYAFAVDQDALRYNSYYDVSTIALTPAFLIACFAALRLAKFNVSGDQQKTHFIGMPTPAVGILVASLPAVLWFAPASVSRLFAEWLQMKWVLYVLIGVLCLLMVSKMQFFKMIPPAWNMQHLWPRLLVLLVGVAALPFLQLAAVPVGFAAYIIVSMVYRQPAAGNT